MLKIISASIFILSALLGSQAYAQKTITLNPNESRVLTNNYLWTLNATCNIQSNNQVKSKIKVSILKNNGRVNGKNLSTGQATSVTVKNNTNIAVSAEPGTQVNLINLSGNGLHAVCST